MSAGESRRRAPAGGEHHDEVVARRYVREVVRDRNLAAVEESFARPTDRESASLVGGETVGTCDEPRR